MEPEKIQAVQQSLGRCLLNKARGKDFLDAFYDEFLAADPRIKPMFAKTDMAKQKSLLRQGLTMLVMYSGGVGLAQNTVRQLAVKHDHEHLNIPPSMYPLWVDSLLRCVKLHDPKYTDELGGWWREAVQIGIEVMKKAY